MRGADQLIAMRRSGKRPAKGIVVLLHTDRATKPNDGEELCIEIADSTPIDGLDLRCLLGMRVVAIGSDHARVTKFVEAAVNAGAQGVIGMEFVRREGEVFERWIAAFNPWTAAENLWKL